MIYIFIDTEIKLFHLKIFFFNYNLLKKGISLNIKCPYVSIIWMSLCLILISVNNRFQHAFVWLFKP